MENLVLQSYLDFLPLQEHQVGNLRVLNHYHSSSGNGPCGSSSSIILFMSSNSCCLFAETLGADVGDGDLGFDRGTVY